MKARVLVVVSVIAVLASHTAAGAEERFRVHGYVQWIAGSKMVLFTDAGVSLALDLTEADQSSYQGVMDGDGVTIEGVVRRPASLDTDSMPLVVETIEPDRPAF